MAASFSSSSSRSYASSSSFSIPPAYTPNSNLASSAGSNWTPNSAVSALTDELSSPPVPSPHPADTFPHTLHSRHRQFSDPCLLEQYVTFREVHRVRYTAEDGVVIFDQPMEVKYEFTTIESAIHFQGDLRRKDLIDCFDIDVVWSDTQSRTDTFGNVRGIGTVQRLKLWSDRQNSAHSISVFANRSDRRFREYPVDFFEGEVRGRDDRRRMLRLNVRGRRGNAPDSRRNPLAAFRRHSDHSHSSSSGARGGPLDIRYLGVQFTRPEGKFGRNHVGISKAANMEVQTTDASSTRGSWRTAPTVNFEESHTRKMRLNCHHPKYRLIPPMNYRLPVDFIRLCPSRQCLNPKRMAQPHEIREALTISRPGATTRKLAVGCKWFGFLAR
ncbi:hypothetical protein PG999_013346 [Apiospora kogelbergensis]|uniref:Uncharacterized protein n=1 Tax=Apiospora kogelbergensis TaxID=1337665 RepID=A0AAW0Q9S8_9PEZI